MIIQRTDTLNRDFTSPKSQTRNFNKITKELLRDRTLMETKPNKKKSLGGRDKKRLFFIFLT